MKPFALCLVLLALPGLSGCSQVTYSYDDQNGYITDYPAPGADIAPLIEDMLNREGTPSLNGYATNGAVRYRVFSAKVLQAGDFTLSPNGTMTSIPFHAHSQMTLPNGQTLDFEHIDSIVGSWKNGRISILYLDAFIGDSHPFTWGAPQDLILLDPGVVERTRTAIANARNRSEMQHAINDVCSAELLLAHLEKHDLIHQHYDFSYWQQANQLALQHADEVLCGTGSLPANLIQAMPPVVQTPPSPAPMPPGPVVYDRYRLFPAPGVFFVVPIIDPAWLHYKNALFTPKFDQSWAILAPTVTRLQLEQRLHDSLAASLTQAQRKAHIEHGPYESRLAQAAYVAQQPGATQADKDTYARISRSGGAELGASTAHLMALKILVDAIQSDIDSQTK